MKIDFNYVRRALASPSTWVLAGLVAAVALQPFACDGPTGGAAPVSPELAALLADVGPNVVMPAVTRAGAAADALHDACGAWGAAAPGPDADAAQLAAQSAWRTAMAAWQEVEVMGLGPAGSSLDVVGGRDLRDEVYSWPVVNPCRVDQETASGAYTSPTFLDDALVNVYGLDALETLLFSEVGANACDPTVDINAQGTWTALGPDDVQRRRAAYAAVVAEGVAASVEALRVAWDPAGDNFSGVLADAGAAESAYESADDALNAVFSALMYVDLVTKDQKLAEPLGIGSCAADCAGTAESPQAGGSNEWIAANLRGFRALFTGGDGAGMDDLLAAEGAEAAAGDVLAALDAADAAVAALQVPVGEGVEGDRASVQAVYDAVKVLTDLLKGDVATVLVLTLPSDAAGDND